jgi:hypothetical protein
MDIDLEMTKTKEQARWMEGKMKDLIELFKVKNVAYDDSFGKTFRSYGPISSLTRISDKFNRIEALILGAENGVTDERLEDTLEDMVNYCLMLNYELNTSKVKEENKHGRYEWKEGKKSNIQHYSLTVNSYADACKLLNDMTDHYNDFKTLTLFDAMDLAGLTSKPEYVKVELGDPRNAKIVQIRRGNNPQFAFENL